jgi:hypothetical protein
MEKIKGWVHLGGHNPKNLIQRVKPSQMECPITKSQKAIEQKEMDENARSPAIHYRVRVIDG